MSDKERKQKVDRRKPEPLTRFEDQEAAEAPIEKAAGRPTVPQQIAAHEAAETTKRKVLGKWAWGVAQRVNPRLRSGRTRTEVINIDK